MLLVSQSLHEPQLNRPCFRDRLLGFSSFYQSVLDLYKVVLSDSSGTRLLPRNDLTQKLDPNSSGSGSSSSSSTTNDNSTSNLQGDVGSKAIDSSSELQQESKHLSGNSITFPQNPPAVAQKEPTKELPSSSSSSSSQPDSSPPKLMPFSMVGTPQRSAFSLLAPSPTPGFTPSPGMFPTSPGNVPPPRLLTSSSLALTSPSRAQTSDIVSTSSSSASSSSAAETASLHAQLALEQQRRREAEVRLEQAMSATAKLEAMEGDDNKQITLIDSLDATAVRIYGRIVPCL